MDVLDVGSGKCGDDVKGFNDVSQGSTAALTTATSSVLRRHHCDLCPKSFERAESLVRHKAKHTGIKPFSCHLCQKTFFYSNDLTRHLRVHADVRPFSCSVCGCSFRARYVLVRHQQTHSVRQSTLKAFAYPITNQNSLTENGYTVYQHDNSTQHARSTCKPYVCDVCHRSFRISDHLLAHRLRHFNSRRFSCELCEKTFTRKHDVKRHQDTHCGIKPYSCCICNKAFYQKCEVTRHMRTHRIVQPFLYDVNSLMPSTADKLTDHKKADEDEHDQTCYEPYACDLCSQSFNDRANLINHRAAHFRGSSFLCDACNKTFSSSEDLLRHKETCKGNELSSGAVGRKTVYRKIDFVQHRQDRMGSRSYQCYICSNTFHTAFQLTRHLRSHTDYMSPACDVNSKSTHKYKFASGRPSVSSDCQVNKPFACHLCQQAFTVSSRLLEHIGSHFNDRDCYCDICKKQFIRRYALKRHNESVHKGIRPYFCEICNKSFYTSCGLVRHRGTHTGEKPYHYRVCEIPFGTKSQLNSHRQTHDSYAMP